jgi:hypothetical protein
VKRYWEVIADDLSKAGWSWGCVATVDREGRTIFVADAHRDDGKRLVVRADEKADCRFSNLKRRFWECASVRAAVRQLPPVMRPRTSDTCQIKKFCSFCEQDYVFRQFAAGNYML